MNHFLLSLLVIFLPLTFYGQIGTVINQADQNGNFLRIEETPPFLSLPSQMNFGVDFINTADRFVAPNVLKLQSDGAGNVTIGDTDNPGNSTSSPRLTINAANDDLMDLRLEGNARIATQASMVIYLDDNNNASSESFMVRRSDQTTLMRINENNNHYLLGNIAIGSTNHASGFRVSVDGKVAAEEVRVELSQAWPDYVFDDGYELTQLEQVKKDINRLGHLPGIPSAEEVEKDGIVLGEMNRLLLEKIEELTLHVINLNERINELENDQ